VRGTSPRLRGEAENPAEFVHYRLAENVGSLVQENPLKSAFHRLAFLWAASCTLLAPALHAAPIAMPVLDTPYPGQLSLSVDLSDSARKIFRVKETIPVSSGALTLYYPKWIPGEHGPTGTIDGVTGLIISGNGQRIAWRRDLEDMFTLHLEVPAGVSALDIEFQFLSPTDGGAFGGSVSATSKIVDLEWNQVAFYPAGYNAHAIKIQPSVKLPAGWGFGTALESIATASDILQFKPVTFETLVDSPLIAGINFKRIDLAPGAKVPVHLDIVADHPGDLVLKDEQIKVHQNLVVQANALFGSHHYDHYDFLFTLSEDTGHFGLEHHQSSDDRIFSAFFTDPDTFLSGGGLLPHEYVHSWNGKFRRPAGLATPNYNVPMKDDLLWVYEGLTEYLGQVLTARSGICSTAQYRDELAATAAQMDKRPGRTWRPLQDTADEAQILYDSPTAWSNWRRGVDFYPEGELLWLDVDTTIRELSAGKRSLDDYIKLFYGIDDGVVAVEPYTFEDVVAKLNQVQPNDWAAFLRQRLDSTDAAAPLGGLARGGWTLAYTDTPSDYFKANEKVRKHLNLIYSLGVDIDTDGDSTGKLRDVLWNSPAFIAGMAPGMKIIAVNGEKFDADQLKAAITAAKDGKAPIEVLVQNLDTFTTLKIDYHEGLKYPQLQRLSGVPDRIGEIVKAKK
jgi:predicted metalloprotease with PDZ domain